MGQVETDMPNPVWDVYGEYRTARLNVKYYSYQLSALTTRNFWIQMILAVSSSSSVASFWFFAAWADGLLWKTLGSIAAILAIYQPIGKLSDRIQGLEKRVTAYRALEFDLERLSRTIADTKKYDKPLKDQFQAIMDRKKELILSYTDPTIDKSLQNTCTAEVKKELPEDRFYEPEEVT